MDKIEAIAYVRGFMEYAGLTEEDLVRPETTKEPTVDDLCPRKRWVPKSRDIYYRITSYGWVYDDTWEDIRIEQPLLELGNVFPTEEDAQEHLANMKAWVELRERSVVYSDDHYFPVTDTDHWQLPGVRFESKRARDLAVEAVGGQERIEKLIKWIHNK